MNRNDYDSLFFGQAVQHYESLFTDSSFESKLQKIQISAVLQILRKYGFEEDVTQFDFACGTGRWMENLSSITKGAIGFDISVDMLNKARNKTSSLTKFNYVQLPSDLKQYLTLSEEKTLITSFRFLLNASDSGRASFVQFINEVSQQRPNTLVLFNNHGNRFSIRGFLNIFKLKAKYNELSHQDVLDILKQSKSQVRVVDIVGIGFFPKKILKLVPYFWKLEQQLISRGYSIFASDQLYICQIGK